MTGHRQFDGGSLSKSTPDSYPQNKSLVNILSWITWKKKVKKSWVPLKILTRTLSRHAVWLVMKRGRQRGGKRGRLPPPEIYRAICP